MASATAAKEGAIAPICSDISAYKDSDGNLKQVSTDSPLPVALINGSSSTQYTTSSNVTKTDASGTISVAESSQLVISADENGFIWEMQAGSDNTSSIFVRDDGVEISDTVGCLELQPGDNADSLRYGTQAVYVYGATSGDTFSCKKIVRA